MKHPYILMVCLLASNFASGQTGTFYYGFDKKIFLTEHPSKAVIRFVDEKTAAGYRNGQATLRWLDKKTAELTLSSNETRNDAVQFARTQKGVAAAHPIYLSDKGGERALTDEILIQFKKGVTPEVQAGIMAKYKLILIARNSVFQTYRASSNCSFCATYAHVTKPMRFLNFSLIIRNYCVIVWKLIFIHPQHHDNFELKPFHTVPCCHRNLIFRLPQSSKSRCFEVFHRSGLSSPALCVHKTSPQLSVS